MPRPLVQWLYQPEASSSLSVIDNLVLTDPLPRATATSSPYWIHISSLPPEALTALLQELTPEWSTQLQQVCVFEQQGLLLRAETGLVQAVSSWLQAGDERVQEIGRELLESWRRFHSSLTPWTFRQSTLDFAQAARPFIMGIVNVTPDSFSDGGLFDNAQKAVEHGLRLVEEGAELLDIGGESTRPGAAKVDVEAEKRRVLPVIEALAKRVSVPISIDTYKAEVAREAVQAGAEIINDISCLRFDPDLPRTIAETGAYFLLMHSRHTPTDMQRAPHYENLWQELVSELQIGVQTAVEAGVECSRIGVDPGLGFGKRLQDNYRILREFSVLREMGFPILIGASRKSFLGTVLQTRDTSQRLEGSLATVAAAWTDRAQFVRVHDVAETARFLRVAEAIRRPPFE